MSSRFEIVSEEIMTQLIEMARTHDSQLLAALLTRAGARLWQGLKLTGRETPENLEKVVELFREIIFEAGTPPTVIVTDGVSMGRVQ